MQMQKREQPLLTERDQWEIIIGLSSLTIVCALITLFKFYNP